jgi:DNA-binding NtrC family response regulator
VRELENTLTRAVVLATGGVVRPEHLGFAALAEAAAEPERIPTFRELEERYLRRALAAVDGNRTRAAEILGISKPRLYRLLEKYGLS